MSRRNCIFNLPGFAIQKSYGYNPLIIEANYRRKGRCSWCESTGLRKKASFIREVRHEPAIAAVYAFKQKLHRLLMYKHRTEDVAVCEKQWNNRRVSS